MAKDTFWFRHDSNARNDPKLVKLRRLSGVEGIGLFWCVIEMLRESETYTLEESHIDDIVYDLRIDKKVFDNLFECGLFTLDNGVFYSKSLLERMRALDVVKEKRRKAGAKGGKAKADNSKDVASATNEPSKTKAKVKQSLASRVELSRVEKNNKNTIEDRQKLFKDRITEANENRKEKCNSDTLNEFYFYWSTIGDGEKKMLFEKTKSFSTSRRLTTWVKNNFNGTEKTTVPKKMRIIQKAETTIEKMERLSMECNN